MPTKFDRLLPRARLAIAAVALVTVAGTGFPPAAEAGSLGSAGPPWQNHDEGRGDVDVSADPAEAVDEVRTAERRYMANMYDGAGAPGSVHFVDRTASSPLVIVAPHAVRHHRAGKIKAPELFTGGIAEALGEKLGASVLAVDGLVPDWGDEWSGRDDEFTRILHALPEGAVIVDLHGMRDSSSAAPVVLGMGRSSGETTAALRASLGEAFGADITDEGRFGARSAYTVVDHMQRCGHAAIQVELAYSARDPEFGKLPATLDRLETGLSSVAAS